MPYPESLVSPMRAELTGLGVKELTTAEDVDGVFADAEGKTTMLVINSVCGCAAANARPAVAMVIQSDAPQPDKYVTVFAGQDQEATNQARTYLAGIPPSSPFIALFSDGEPVFALERRHIEGRSASAIATDLVAACQKYCGAGGSDSDTPPADVSESGPTASDTFRSIL